LTVTTQGKIDFEIRILPPSTAKIGDELKIDLLITSNGDPTLTKTISLKINNTSVSFAPTSSSLTVNGVSAKRLVYLFLIREQLFVAIKDIVSMFREYHR